MIAKAVANGARSAAEAYTQNRTIHRSVVEAAANPILVELFESVWDRARALQIFEQFHAVVDDPDDLLSAHYKLTEAMRVGPDHAHEVMRGHIVEGFGPQNG